MDQITPTLTLDEFNRMLDGLSYRPFREVADLIYKLREQGESQIAAKENAKQSANAGDVNKESQ